MNRLREEYAAQGKADLFEQLKDCPVGRHGPISYANLAAQLEMSEGAVKTAVYRLRHRHRELLREEVSQTVAAPAEVEAELRHLIEVISA